MVMVFKKYPSISNHYETQFIDKCTQYIETNSIVEDFIVLEKVHGANYAFYVDFYRAGDTKVIAAKRTDFIGKNEKFFDHKSVYAKYSELAYLLSREIGGDIIVYGEIYGGSYPEYASTQKPVQKHIKYCPKQDFIVFDIARYVGGVITFIDYDTVLKLCQKVGMPVLTPLFRGSFKDCMAFSPEFNSTIPAMHGLPDIENNLVEGIVIRHNLPVALSNGDRIIIKNKNSAFLESTNKRPSALAEDVITICRYLKEAITYNRVLNICGKLGEKPFYEYVNAFIEDAIDDSVKEEYNSLSKQEQKAVRKSVKKEAVKLVKKVVNA